MHFNHTVSGLSDQATLGFRNVTLSLDELRYAIDIAMLSSVPDELVAGLEAQGIEIEVGSYDREGEWTSRQNSTWLQQGVACEVWQPGMMGAQRGKLKLRLSLEFCPDNWERAMPHVVVQPVGMTQTVAVAGL